MSDQRHPKSGNLGWPAIGQVHPCGRACMCGARSDAGASNAFDGTPGAPPAAGEQHPCACVCPVCVQSCVGVPGLESWRTCACACLSGACTAARGMATAPTASSRGIGLPSPRRCSNGPKAPPWGTCRRREGRSEPHRWRGHSCSSRTSTCSRHTAGARAEGKRSGLWAHRGSRRAQGEGVELVVMPARSRVGSV